MIAQVPTLPKKRKPNRGSFKKGHTVGKGKKRAAGSNHPLNRTRPIREALKAILAEPVSDEDRRTKARAIWDRVVDSARAGEAWAVNFIAERTEGKVATVIRQESQRRYETLGDKELSRAIAARQRRAGLLVGGEGDAAV
jgi:hypothetical protein